MTAPLVVLTQDQLQELLERAVDRALEARAAADEWLTADDVARMLDVERATLPTLVRRDGLPCYRPGRGYTFRKSEVIAWLESRAEGNRSHSAKHGARLRALRWESESGAVPTRSGTRGRTAR